MSIIVISPYFFFISSPRGLTLPPGRPLKMERSGQVFEAICASFSFSVSRRGAVWASGALSAI
jgi:hypothetical protein